MRLLRIDEDDVGLSLVEVFSKIPEYAILSHTWGVEEVTFSDIVNSQNKSKEGYKKLEFCRTQALRDQLRYFWIDTCCIDKSNYAEVTEALNSIFRWYGAAKKCYVYLSDVYGDEFLQSSFRKSRWFTRSWTLPELLAPKMVEFFTADGDLVGDKISMVEQLHECTAIPIQALKGYPLSSFGVDERMRWVQGRTATRGEDEAYSLMGIFDVFMTIIYGEGQENAFRRLRSQIMKRKAFGLSKQHLRYSSLQGAEIRIVILHPGEEGTPLSIDIDTRPISSPIPYRAISYAWGDEPPIHVVQVGTDEVTHIRPNLYHALQRMRLGLGQVHLWIDSICIDQHNDNERNIQVQRMGDIFRNASDVWIWLGEEDSTSGLAMDLIPYIKHTSFRWSNLWYKQHGFMALNQFLQRPWFSRGWVIQEAAFSANSVIFCGSREVSAIDLAIAVSSVQDRLRSKLLPLEAQVAHSHSEQYCFSFHDSSATRLLAVIDRVFCRHTDGKDLEKQLPLEMLVDIGTYFETSDPRDAIYALINLANDSQPSSPRSITPDYGRPPLDVFADFVLHCCYTRQSLDVLCRPWAPVKAYTAFSVRANHEIRKKKILEIPSWIASREKLSFGDPSKRSTYRLNGSPLLDAVTRRYNAHYDTAPHIRIGNLPETNVCNGSLHVWGTVIGDVTRQSMRMANGIITKEALDILQINDGCQKNPGTFEIAWRTLCAGRRETLPASLRLELQDMFDQASEPESSGIDIEELIDQEQSADMKEFLELVRNIVWNRRTFQAIPPRSQNLPLVGLAPQHTKVGDRVCILYGCSVPVILRHRKDKEGHEFWNLIGEAYVFGCMKGEAIRDAGTADSGVTEVEFEIR